MFRKWWQGSPSFCLVDGLSAEGVGRRELPCPWFCIT
eukprot:COSAG06_NODE_46160_length_349_cov_0.620000_1_plen_36_part_10